VHVAHVVPVFPPYRSGTGNVAWQQALHLSRLGVDVSVFTTAVSRPPSSPHGVNVVALRPMLRRGNAACLPQILLRTAPFDIIHLHYPFFGTAELIAARRRLGGPRLVLQYQFDVLGQGWSSRVFRWHRRFVLPSIVKSADAVVVTSRDYVESSFLWDRLQLLEPRMVVVPAGVDLDSFHPHGETAARGEAPHVLFIGSLDRAHYFKGLNVLLQAMRLLPHVELSIGGDGNLRPTYEAMARDLGVGDRVRFLGDISDAELPPLYRSGDVLVLPSVDRTEAFGLVLLEAMACARPVVASRLAGVRSLIEDGRNGYLARPGDAADLAEKITLSVRHRDTLGNCGRRLVEERFGWPMLGRELMTVYRRVMSYDS